MVLAALMFVTSCSNVDSKLESQIPADAVMVAKLDVMNLIDHAGVEVKDGKLVLPQKFAAMLKEMGEDMSDSDGEVSKLLESGIDFKGSIYCFVPADGGKNAFVALIPVNDAKKLQAYIEDQMKAKMEDKDGILALENAEPKFAISDDVLYVMSDVKQGAGECVKALSGLDKNISANALAAKALATDDDLNIYFDNTFFQKYMGSAAQLPQAGAALELLKDVKGSAYHLNLAGGLSLKHESDIDANSDLAKLVNAVTDKPSAELLALMPKAKNAAVLGFSLNGEGVLGLEMLKPYTEKLSGEAEMAQLLDIFKSIKGPVALGVASETLSPEDVSAVLAFKCGKTADLKNLLKGFLGTDAYTENGDELIVNQTYNGIAGSLVVKNGVVCVKGGSKVYPENMNGVSGAKDAIGKSLCGFYVALADGDAKVELVSETPDIKGGSTQLTVTEGGKKLGVLDALAVIYNLAKKMPK